MGDQHLVVLSARHRPFEVALMLASFFIGVRGLFTTNTQGILYNSVGPWADLWSAGLVIGPGLCLLSLFLKLPDNLLWERVGICLLVTVFSSYLITGYLVTNSYNFNYSYVALIVTVGGVGRVVQISQDIIKLKRAMEWRKRDP